MFVRGTQDYYLLQQTLCTKQFWKVPTFSVTLIGLTIPSAKQYQTRPVFYFIIIPSPLIFFLISNAFKSSERKPPQTKGVDARLRPEQRGGYARHAASIRDDICYFSLTDTDMLCAGQTGRPCLASWRAVRDRPALLTCLVKGVNKESGLPRLHPSSLHTLFYSHRGTSVSFHLAHICHRCNKSISPQSWVNCPALETKTEVPVVSYLHTQKHITCSSMLCCIICSACFDKNVCFSLFFSRFHASANHPGWQQTLLPDGATGLCSPVIQSITWGQALTKCKYAFPGEIWRQSIFQDTVFCGDRSIGQIHLQVSRGWEVLMASRLCNQTTLVSFRVVPQWARLA